MALAGRVRASGGPGWLASGVGGGAVATMAGFVPLAAFGFILAGNIEFRSPGSVQTLNVLDNDFFVPAVAGFVVFGIVTGLASAVSKTPARWTGWVLFAFGGRRRHSPISWLASLAMFLWSLVAGICLRHADRAGAARYSVK